MPIRFDDIGDRLEAFRSRWGFASRSLMLKGSRWRLPAVRKIRYNYPTSHE